MLPLLEVLLRESSDTELREVQEFIQQLLTQPEVEIKPNPNREVVEVRKTRGATYQLEKVKCGKKTCKCAKGRLHGPYWYSYQSVGGKTVSKYIGKNLVQQDGEQVAAKEEWTKRLLERQNTATGKPLNY